MQGYGGISTENDTKEEILNWNIISRQRKMSVLKIIFK